MKRKLSKRQLEMLAIIADIEGSDGWGEVYSCWSESMGGTLGMMNFDRIGDSLERHGLITTKDPETGDAWIELTETGRAALAEKEETHGR